MATKEEEYRKAMAEAVVHAQSIRDKKSGGGSKEEVKKEALEDLLPEISETLPDGWAWMSDVFGVTPVNIDVPVRVREEEEWAEHLRMFIPEPTPGYLFPVKELEAMLLGLNHRNRTLLTGEAGTGKSSLGQEACAKLRIPFMRVNCREDMESSAIFGSIHVEDGTLGWIPGPAEELARHGGMLQIDEISAAPPGINMAMQWMLEDKGKVFLADKPGKPAEKFVDPVEEFHIVATDNTRLQGDVSGTFAGTQVQNSAMLDRFNNVLELDYPSKKDEEKMIKGRAPGIPKELAKKMVLVAGHIRAAFKTGAVQYPLSPRGCLEWAWKVEQTRDIPGSFKRVYFNKLINDDRKQVEGFWGRVFPDHKL